MKVLHVEDKIDWFKRTVEPELNRICSEVIHASNYEDALRKLESSYFDYVIVDQSIPLSDLSSEADVANGIRFADDVRKSLPGTPILILTGQNQEEVTEKYIEDQEQEIFWDGRPKGLVKSRSKSRLVKAISLIEDAAKELAELEHIELEIFNNLDLDLYEKRVVRLFAKSNGAVAALVKRLSGGLSGSTVLEITLVDENHHNFQFALAKIDSIEEVDKDVQNFKEHINKLPVASFPNLLGKFKVGCGRTQGVFYQFANEYKSDYFDVLKSDQAVALEVLKNINVIFNNWEQAKAPNEKTLGEIRAHICSDSKFAKLASLLPKKNYHALEQKRIRYDQSIQHGDLHGKNILLNKGSAQPIIIDYGDVGLAPSSLDVVTLELSPYFHPDMQDHFDLSIEYFINWFDEERCIQESPHPAVTKFLKAMKKERAFMNNSYVAVVYAYALRQLTYKDTNHDIALALVEASLNYFENQ